MSTEPGEGSRFIHQALSKAWRRMCWHGQLLLGRNGMDSALPCEMERFLAFNMNHLSMEKSTMNIEKTTNEMPAHCSAIIHSLVMSQHGVLQGTLVVGKLRSAHPHCDTKVAFISLSRTGPSLS